MLPGIKACASYCLQQNTNIFIHTARKQAPRPGYGLPGLFSGRIPIMDVIRFPENI